MTYQYTGFIPTAGYSLGIANVPIARAEIRARITVKRLQEVVAAYYNLSPYHMTSASRERRHSHPRQVAMYLAREMLGKSLPDIGRMFGNRDHTTVLYAVKAVTERLHTDENLGDEIQSIQRRLRQA